MVHVERKFIKLAKDIPVSKMGNQSDQSSCILFLQLSLCQVDVIFFKGWSAVLEGSAVFLFLIVVVVFGFSG
jgi:hypothetical protein